MMSISAVIWVATEMNFEEPVLTKRTFREIAGIVYSNFGIELPQAKYNLLVNRLRKVLRLKKLSTYEEYLALLKRDNSGHELQVLADAISTNHTYFYREPAHFTYFEKTILPLLKQKLDREKDLRVWCAASATGEEPYTLAMIEKEFFGDDYARWNAGLLATDISEKALKKAYAGSYPVEEITALPPDLKKYFINYGETVQVIPQIRKEVTFRKVNLMNPFRFKKPFQVIFCRNVMIYFDEPTKENLIEKMYNCTTDGGFLLIGHSESINRLKNPYTYVAPGIYQKVLT